MDNDWHECINVDQHLSMMMMKANVAHFYSNAMLSFNGVAAILYVLGDYVIRFVYSAKDYNNTLRQLPIKLLLPFETEKTPIFELLLVTLFLHVILISFTVAVLNGLIFTLVSLVFPICFFILSTLLDERICHASLENIVA